MSRLLILFFSFALLVGCNGKPDTSQADAESAGGAGENQPEAANSAADGENAAQDDADKVTLQVLDYQQIQDLVASHKGKVVVMDCWSTSCEPCVREFPNLVKLQNKYGPEKLACISLSFDYEGIGKPADVEDMVLGFLKKQNATFDNVLSSVESDELYQKMDLTAVPAVYVYRPNGELVKRFDIESEGGEFTYEEIGQLVAELMAGL